MARAATLSEPRVLAHAKRRLFPDADEPDTYAVTDTQFAREEWLHGQAIPPEVRDTLAPFNHVRLGSGYPDLVGVRRLDAEILESADQPESPPLLAFEAKGFSGGRSIDLQTGILQAHDRLQSANATYLVAPSEAITSDVEALSNRLNVGLLGVIRDGEVTPITVPRIVGAAGTTETEAIRFQASASGVSRASFGLNHPKNYLAYPLAMYHPDDTRAVMERWVVNAERDARAGAVFLGLVESKMTGDELSSLGEEVVRFAVDRYGSVEAALGEFEHWQRSRERFCELAPAWGQLTRRVLWAYPATQLLIEAIQSMQRSGYAGPTLVELVEWLHARQSTFAVELFIRGSDDARGRVLDDEGTLQADALQDGNVYHSPTVFQLKAMLYHAGILQNRGAEPHRLDPVTDDWGLRTPLG